MEGRIALDFDWWMIGERISAIQKKPTCGPATIHPQGIESIHKEGRQLASPLKSSSPLKYCKNCFHDRHYH